MGATNKKRPAAADMSLLSPRKDVCLGKIRNLAWQKMEEHCEEGKIKKTDDVKIIESEPLARKIHLHSGLSHLFY